MSIPARATAVTDAALASLRQQRHVVIPAHAGAGKTGGATSGTVRIARELANDGLRVALLVAQNDQVVDTLHRLTTIWPAAPVTFVAATTSWTPAQLPDWIRDARRRPAGLTVARHGSTADTATRQRMTTQPGLYVMTVDKWRYLAPTGADIGNQRVTVVDPFDVVVVDEAWMAPAALWEESLRYMTRLVALVGDPGQIMPWQPGGRFYPAMAGSPIEPLPSVVQAQLPDRVDVFELSVTRRNPSHTTAITGRLPAYAGAPTRPMFDAAEVGVTFGAASIARDDIDRLLGRMAEHGVALHRLPAGVAPQNDPVVARACAQAAHRLLVRGAELDHPSGARHLHAADMAVLVAHHDQRVAVEAALADLGLVGPAAPRVATFNTIQGATVAVSVVWHPLSGRTDLSEFHADTGRLTVGLTRHTHGCLLLGRGDVGDRLFGAPVTEDLEGDARDGRHLGLNAHRLIWEALAI